MSDDRVLDRTRRVLAGPAGLPGRAVPVETGSGSGDPVAEPQAGVSIRRILRDVMDVAGIENVTPHRFRRTVATVVNDAQGALLASELLGHTDPRITMQHYIQRNETVNPVTAEHLERAFGWAG